MAVMGRCIVGLGFMTFGADGVPLGNQLITVRVVAIATYDASLSHLAQHQGPENIDLVEDLAIVPIQRRLEG